MTRALDAWHRLRARFLSARAYQPGREPWETDRRQLVDADTRTFWSKGGNVSATLVETETLAVAPRSLRVTSLLARYHRGDAAPRRGRPRANPAFSEGVFVELMRAGRFERAFALLAPECQHAWGDAAAFARAQRRQALKNFQGMRVKSVRFPAIWEDVTGGGAHQDVAELDVDYVLDNGRHRQLVPRTVHLVGIAGQWRSVCYPPPEPAARSGAGGNSSPR